MNFRRNGEPDEVVSSGRLTGGEIERAPCSSLYIYPPPRDNSELHLGATSCIIYVSDFQPIVRESFLRDL